MQDEVAALDGNRTAAEQAAACQAILDNPHFDVSRLILPKTGKKTWKNAVLVLCRMRPDRVFSYLEEILVWLQDVNWPGEDIIFGFMMGLPDEMLLPALTRVMDRATIDHDEIWLEELGRLLRARRERQ